MADLYDLATATGAELDALAPFPRPLYGAPDYVFRKMIIRHRMCEALEMLVQGWSIIESDGSWATIQAPEDWEGDRLELVVSIEGWK